MDELKGKVALITGAGRGFGYATAECALFLASEVSNYLTGQMLGPNGGNVMA